MHPKNEVIGGAGETCARLCPLGCTAVGRMNMENTRTEHNTNLCHNFRIQQFGEVEITTEQSDDLNAILKRFWNLESVVDSIMHELSTGIGDMPKSSSIKECHNKINRTCTTYPIPGSVQGARFGNKGQKMQVYFSFRL